MDPIVYTYDADYHCPRCTADYVGAEHESEIPGDAEDSEGNPIGAVFSWDEWWQSSDECESLHCGDCGEEIDTAHASPHSDDCDEWEVPSDFVDAATDAYFECALWSSLDDDGRPLDDNYSVEDIEGSSYGHLASEVEAFIASEWSDLHDLDPAQVGHDFWLTRNGHGAGFWDRGLGERGDRLTKAAHAYGGADLFVCDDGTLSL